MEVDKKVLNPKNNRGGRPKKSQLDIKKKYLKAYFSETEYPIAKQNLSKLGYSHFTTFVYDALLNGKIRCKIQHELPDNIQYELRKIGNNYNQIAKLLHVHLSNHDLKSINDWMIEVRESFNIIIHTMKKIDINYKNSQSE